MKAILAAVLLAGTAVAQLSLEAIVAPVSLQPAKDIPCPDVAGCKTFRDMVAAGDRDVLSTNWACFKTSESYVGRGKDADRSYGPVAADGDEFYLISDDVRWDDSGGAYAGGSVTFEIVRNGVSVDYDAAIFKRGTVLFESIFKKSASESFGGRWGSDEIALHQSFINQAKAVSRRDIVIRKSTGRFVEEFSYPAGTTTMTGACLRFEPKAEERPTPKPEPTPPK
jgi:hypothetical protein